MKLVFLGPPGAGKGTQAERICEKYGLVHISTGDMLREQIEAQTDIGRLAGELINRGELVPDEVVIRMVMDRIAMNDANRGFILDGFPRTVAQAEKLPEFIDVDLVVNIDVPMEKLIHRITNRRSCPHCDIVYNIAVHKAEICDKCGRQLVLRDDDTPEVAMERFHVYRARTLPIINYYEAKNVLVHVNGDQVVEAVTDEIVREIEKGCL